MNEPLSKKKGLKSFHKSVPNIDRPDDLLFNSSKGRSLMAQDDIRTTNSIINLIQSNQGDPFACRREKTDMNLRPSHRQSMYETQKMRTHSQNYEPVHVNIDEGRERLDFET